MSLLSRAKQFATSSMARLWRRRQAPALPKAVENPQLHRPAYADRHQGATFLVFGTGPSLREQAAKIHAFIEREQPITIGPNTIAEFIHPHYHVFTSRHRLLDYGHTFDAAKSKLLVSPTIPLHFIRQVHAGDFEVLMYRDDNEADFDILDGVIQASCKSAAIVSIGAAIVMGARRIVVAGLDGFGSLARSGQRLHYNAASEPKHLPGTAAYLEHYETAHRYHVRFLRQIHEYMAARGLEPFTIITPTEFEEYYQDGYLDR
ncbi:MAG: hypothetical protein HYY96_06865 [Candidatus Tectomicrobia bacterium]|nr:hypothetical protein [Candidatus Tectomicrobia bacterium]